MELRDLVEALLAFDTLRARQWVADATRLPVHMPRLRQVCEQAGPEPLRRRGVFAPPDFLTFA